MSFVEWDVKYSVGIKEIDEQHKRLLEITNNLFNACTQGKDVANAEFKDAIKDAVNYVKTHFAFEEDLLTKNNYPELKRHKLEHEAFVKKILEEAKNFETGKQFVPNNFVRFLRDWTLEHIAVSDKKYALFFKSNGL